MKLLGQVDGRSRRDAAVAGPGGPAAGDGAARAAIERNDRRLARLVGVAEGQRGAVGRDRWSIPNGADPRLRLGPLAERDQLEATHGRVSGLTLGDDGREDAVRGNDELATRRGPGPGEAQARQVNELDHAVIAAGHDQRAGQRPGLR